VEIGIERVQDVTLRAKNVGELRTFYRTIGLREVLVRGDDFVVFAAGNSEIVIHVATEQPMAATGVGFLVDDTAAIGERLRAANISYEGPMPLRPGKVGIRLADPNGNILEFFQRERA
jgi:catechol-2,3-dioxygenase